MADTAITSVIPIKATIGFSDQDGVFKLKATFYIHDGTGYKRIVEEEKTVDLGALVQILINNWTGINSFGHVATVMSEPGAINVPKGTVPGAGYNMALTDFNTTAVLGDLVDDVDIESMV